MSKVKEMSEVAVKAREVLESAGLKGFIVVQNISESGQLFEVVLEGDLNSDAEIMVSEILLERSERSKMNAAKYLLDYYGTEVKTKWLPLAKTIFANIESLMAETEEEEKGEESESVKLSEHDKNLIEVFTKVFYHDLEVNEVQTAEFTVSKIKDLVNEKFPLTPMSKTDVVRVVNLLCLSPIAGKGITAKYSLRVRETKEKTTTTENIQEKPIEITSDTLFGEVLKEEVKDALDIPVKSVLDGYQFAKSIEEVATGEFSESSADEFLALNGSEMQVPVLLELLRESGYFVDIHKNTFFYKAL